MEMRRSRQSWGYYPSYTPSRPKAVDDGIKLKSQRGEIGNTWWSKRWIDALEAFNMGARLARGKTYARNGQVISIDIGTGSVHAAVQGSMAKPYRVSIKLEPISQLEWNSIIDLMANRAIFSARLLCGEMPQNIEELFVENNISLFPSKRRDLNTDCSCPDDANPCKHIAAVYLILAEMFDADPFLIFKLRGMSKEVLLESLRNNRAAPMNDACLPSMAIETPILPGKSSNIESAIDHFWDLKKPFPSFVETLQRPAIDKVLLKRVGKSPFSIDDKNVTELLAVIFDHVANFTLKKLQEDHS